jgi:hypothetical protein
VTPVARQDAVFRLAEFTANRFEICAHTDVSFDAFKCLGSAGIGRPVHSVLRVRNGCWVNSCNCAGC